MVALRALQRSVFRRRDFLAGSLVRRLRMPNPLVDLPYLRQWNTLLLGIGLMLFRFCLLATIILIPQSLSIHGFEADQIGPAVFWTAAAAIPHCRHRSAAAPLRLDSRLLMAADSPAWLRRASSTRSTLSPGPLRTITARNCSWVSANRLLSSAWSPRSSCKPIFSGGLSKPQAALTFSAFFHIIRLFGGQMGVAFMTHFIAVREQLHSNLLGLHVQQGNWINDAALRQLTAGLYAKSSGPGRRNRPRSWTDQRARSPAGVHPDIHRWIPSNSVGLCCGSIADRSASEISAELPANSASRMEKLRQLQEGQIMKSRAGTLLRFPSACSQRGTLAAQEAKPSSPRHITLEEAVQLALKHNHVVRIAGYQVEEKHTPRTSPAAPTSRLSATTATSCKSPTRNSSEFPLEASARSAEPRSRPALRHL